VVAGLTNAELLLILLVLGLVLGLPIAGILIGAKVLTRALRRRSPAEENRHLAAELHQAQLRIEELDARVKQLDEKATGTRAPLDRPRDARRPPS
jgi:hypothetical protein